MKILHTADWHIGKSLHKFELEEDHLLFFEWLINTIKEEEVDLLLVAGDVFEMSNPSAQARKIYYQVLQQLISKNTKVIITGGNHDSVAMLNAPREILEALDITIVGGVELDNLEREIVPIYSQKNELELLVLAVPYLRDKDIRKAVEGQTYEDKTEAIRQGITQHYQQLVDICGDKYSKEVPMIAMGHLYMQSSKTSDSEREIQIGNLAGINVSMLPKNISYLALGHIHRPQVLEANECMRYSGSPIPLSFSERKDDKQVVLIEINGNTQISVKPTLVPKARELRKFTGTLDQVREKLENYQPEYPLTSLVEVEVKEKEFNALILSEVNNWRASEWTGNFKILLARAYSEKGQKRMDELFDAGTSIEELSPKEVFTKRLESEEIAEKKKVILEEAFAEIWQEILEED